MSLLPIRLATRSERLGDLESFIEGLELAVGPRSAQKIEAEILARMVRRGTPLILSDVCHFLIHAPDALSVVVVGDWNGWNPEKSPLRRLSRFSDLWYRVERFPIDARLAYRFVIDGAHSLNDPGNPHIEREVFGENTALRMSGYVLPAFGETPTSDVRKGRVRKLSIDGHYARQVKVWIPPTIPRYAELKILYVHDGEETERIGLLPNILNNLYHFEPHTPPVAVAFVDPAARNLEYMLNTEFADWFALELVPMIETKLRLRIPGPESRGVTGASLGGLLSGYLGMMHSEIFGNVAAQSPSFWVENKLLIRQFVKLERLPLRWYLHTGNVMDAEEDTRDMLRILQQKGYDVTYRETSESHNWANWRGRYAEIIRWFAKGAEAKSSG